MELDVGIGGFSFVWTIENFSSCLQKKGEELLSPSFMVDMLEKTEWYLSLIPRGKENPNYIGLFLNRASDKVLQGVAVNYVLSVRQTNGSFKKRKHLNYVFDVKSGYGFPAFLMRDELSKEGSGYLFQDTLTVRCRMLKTDTEKIASRRSLARTRIGVKNMTYIWTLENFISLQPNEKRTTIGETSTFIMDLFLIGGVSSEEKIQIEIKQIDTSKLVHSICEISLLDADENVAHFVRDEQWFEVGKGEQIWEFPSFIEKSKIMAHERQYLPNGTLTLQCKFVVSTGVEFSKLEPNNFVPSSLQTSNTLSKDYELFYNQKIPVLSGSLKDNLQCLYTEGKCSDLIVRTPNKDFPVHKAILCARSTVFSAMFERDMKENLTGIIKIEDLDDDIVSSMLLFMYTDTIENLEWGIAHILYFAADKYEIVTLKRKCSNFLKANLNTLNFCELLVLSDMHQDVDMKLAVQDFIFNHASEIISSKEWKKFIQDHVHLAADAMLFLCMKNWKL